MRFRRREAPRAGRAQGPVPQNARSASWPVEMSPARPTTRSILIAAAVATCCKCVFSMPRHSAFGGGRRPARLATGSLRSPRDIGSVAAPPHWHTRLAPLAALQSAPATGDGGGAPSPWVREHNGLGWRGAAILEAEPDDENTGPALAINVLPPDGRDLALRTAGLPLLPIDRELGEIVGPVGLGLPALDRPRGAAERDAVVVPAGGEQGCADISAIDEMLPWCQVFGAQSLVDGVGTLDGSGGRVHVREEVRHGRLACLTDMHHIASPLRVAFLAIARLRIIGGLDPLRGGG